MHCIEKITCPFFCAYRYPELLDKKGNFSNIKPDLYPDNIGGLSKNFKLVSILRPEPPPLKCSQQHILVY